MLLDDLYQEILLEHYKSPRNFGKLENADWIVHLNNPACGDEIDLQIIITEDDIVDVKFDGKGCAISQASASMMTSAIKGKKLSEAQKFLESFLCLMTGKGNIQVELDDLEALEGVKRLPVRIKCATLAWSALEKILKQAKTQ